MNNRKEIGNFVDFFIYMALLHFIVDYC